MADMPPQAHPSERRAPIPVETPVGLHSRGTLNCAGIRASTPL